MMVEKRSSSDPPASVKLARWSCQSCKLRKRKCTKELPSCRLCVRGRRSCSYQTPLPPANQQSNLAPDTGLVHGNQVLRNDFPVSLFLDPALFHCCAPRAPRRCQLSIPPRLEDVLGDIASRKALAAEYFKNTSNCMPIISRVRFYGSLLCPSLSADPGIACVLLAMKLVLSSPEEADSYSENYIMAKEFILHMEMAGYLNIHSLQAAIMIANYEMGHAIFPGAFNTVSTCARYATTLGINGTSAAHGKCWIEQEERNRAWWAIVILDRTINLGFRGQHICVPDPQADTVLPVDDNAWEQGVLPEGQTQNLLSTPCLKNGRYARLAQAINLLSQVYRQISSSQGLLRLDLDNIAQLERTLFALEKLASFEEREQNACCLPPMAICYSSILLLRTTYLSEPSELITEDGRQQAQYAIRDVLAKTFGHFKRYYNGWGSLDRFPPLALDWLYRSAVAHVFLSYDAGSPDSDGDIDELKEALKAVSQRWRAASHYLRLLETRQAVKIPL